MVREVALISSPRDTGEDLCGAFRTLKITEKMPVPASCVSRDYGGPDLEQQLVFHNSLHRFNEEVIELQTVSQLLSELLGTGTG